MASPPEPKTVKPRQSMSGNLGARQSISGTGGVKAESPEKPETRTVKPRQSISGNVGARQSISGNVGPRQSISGNVGPRQSISGNVGARFSRSMSLNLGALEKLENAVEADDPETSTLYLDPLSQACRALLILTKMNKLPFNEKHICLMKGQHKSEEYKRVNTLCKVPALSTEDGWILTESIAIGKYLCSTQKVDERWYPVDPRARARVDEFLAWHHIGLRAKVLDVFYALTYNKKAAVDAADMKTKVDELERGLAQLEDMFLKTRQYVAGNQITLADLWGANEVYQVMTVGYDVSKRYHLVDRWVSKVREFTNPYWDEVAEAIKHFGEQHKYDFENFQ